MRSTLKVFDKPPEAVTISVSKLGCIAQVMTHSRVHLDFPVAFLKGIVGASIRHNFVKVYFSSGGTPVGYVIYAFVAPDVESRFFATGRWEMHESEWNEGPQWWILDFAAPGGYVKEILADLRDVLFKDIKTLRYFRIKNGKAISREVSRSDRCHFFRT